jgi:hypothetical protein
VAVRRSPLRELAPSGPRSSAGRPDRESYLHLIDIVDILEAVRRIFAAAVSPTGVIVQRFVLADVSAVVTAEGDSLAVDSAYGVGDLLAAGLVVPDRHILGRDGAVRRARIGRKAQMTLPRNDGGLLRVPVPMRSAGVAALEPDQLAALARLFRETEAVLGPLECLRASLAGASWQILGAHPAPARHDMLLG